MRIKNLPSIESMNGSQDALVIEQTDGSEDKSRKVSPAQIKQYVLGNSIDDIYSVMGQNGAKNLIPYPYANDSITDHGVTFTVNNDGTVVANGTANGTAQLYLVRGNLSLSDPGNLVINTNKPLFLSGCPSGGGNNTFRIQYGLTDGTTYWAKTASDTGSGVKITPVAGLNSYCFDVIKIMVFDRYTVNNLTFKPMLRLAADTDSTYQPYAMTNKQLTEEIGDLSQTGLTGDSVAEQLGTAKGQIATKVEGLVYARTDDTSLTAKMDAIKAQRKSGAYIMYCSSANPDFATIGYCTAIGLTVVGAVSVIVAVNSQTGEIWTNGNTSQNAGAWRGWKKIG